MPIEKHQRKITLEKYQNFLKIIGVKYRNVAYRIIIITWQHHHGNHRQAQEKLIIKSDAVRYHLCLVTSINKIK